MWRSLRLRLFIPIFLCLGAVLAAFSWFGLSVVHARLDNLESSANLRLGTLLRAQIDSDAGALAELGKEWAFNDSVFREIGRANLGDSLLIDSRRLTNKSLDAVAFFKTEKAMSVPFLRGGIPKKDIAAIAKQCNLAQTLPPKKPIIGMVGVDGRFYLVAALPSLSSTGSGQPAGWILTVRAVTSTTVKDIGSQLGLKLQLLPFKAYVKQFEGSQRIIPGTNWLHRRTLNQGTDVIGVGLRDPMGRSPGGFFFEQPRESRALSIDLISSFVAWVFIGTVGCVGLAILAFEIFALRRLTKLASEVEAVTKDARGTVSDFGNDELGTLGGNIASMLIRIRDYQFRVEQHQHSVEVSNRRLESMNTTLEHMVFERTAEIEAKTKVLENALTGIALIDHRGYIDRPNHLFARIVEIEPAHSARISWRQLIEEPHRDAVRLAHRQALAKGRCEFEITGIRLNGTKFHGQVVLVCSKSSDGSRLLHCFLKDVTEQKSLEQKIHYQAYHDALTGLPNRLYFTEKLSISIRQLGFGSKAIALMFIDLDNFKFVNDSLGHEDGDHLLRIVGRRITHVLPTNSVVARFGGDEFTVLLEHMTSKEEALKTANRILENLKQPVSLSTHQVFVTPSIGLVYSQDPRSSTEELLRNADTAMYHAKGNGKNRVEVFDPEMKDRIVERLELETALRRAVENEEFEVLYQPIVQIETRRIVGAEALVRWVDKDNVFIPPAKFVPIAEETGLIEAIGQIVLRKACSAAKFWLKRLADPNEFIISVNASAKEVHRNTYVRKVQQVLDETLLDPRNLKLEITESVLLEDGDLIIERLHQLKNLGIHLALDDFGTGYSSLSYLQRLPVDTLKIDRSFVSVMGLEGQPTAIVAAIVNLCQALDLVVTGEGIETEEQLDELRVIGCHLGQGYLFSKPISIDDFTDLLAEQKQRAA